MYYASFGMLAIVIHIIINFEAMKRPRSGIEVLTWKRYGAFLRGLLLYYAADVLWGFLFDLKNVPLVYADTALYKYVAGSTTLESIQRKKENITDAAIALKLAMNLFELYDDKAQNNIK